MPSAVMLDAHGDGAQLGIVSVKKDKPPFPCNKRHRGRYGMRWNNFRVHLSIRYMKN